MRTTKFILFFSLALLFASCTDKNEITLPSSIPDSVYIKPVYVYVNYQSIMNLPSIGSETYHYITCDLSSDTTSIMDIKHKLYSDSLVMGYVGYTIGVLYSTMTKKININKYYNRNDSVKYNYNLNIIRQINTTPLLDYYPYSDTVKYKVNNLTDGMTRVYIEGFTNEHEYIYKGVNYNIRITATATKIK